MDWQQVADRVWLTVTQPDDANVTLVAGDERAMLVDAGGTAEVGAAVLASARELVDVPVDLVVITHHHHDHWHGLAGMDDVESIAQEDMFDDDTPDELRTTNTFSILKGIDLGNCFVELTHLGPAHTQTDTVVHVPSRRVIIFGDLLEESPQFDETSSFRNWGKAMDGALQASKPDTVFIPGHGEPMDREQASLSASMMGFMYPTVEAMMIRGTGIDRVYDVIEAWPYDEETVRAMLPFIAAELKAEGVEPRTQLPLLGVPGAL